MSGCNDLVADVNECLIIPGACGNGSCENVPGAYRCRCHRGFEDPMNMQMCMGELILSPTSPQSSPLLVPFFWLGLYI